MHPKHLSPQSKGSNMNIRKSALRSASVLTAASAALWLGSAVAAPLPPSYPTSSRALFASTMGTETPTEGLDSDAAKQVLIQILQASSTME